MHLLGSILQAIVAKGQEISEVFFLVQKTNELFLQISALASKSGRIKKIKALYYTN